ncbi:hypothetical protein [Microvirga mediterraneensis]|uniref:Uncharacterized protein n=1 Tax=Microvirga mediterraneensis TaxID=2754695 RepID=A0A838BL95_9HYPH|nr:hypothetical protein [Microvirga mediterraneensis]MBA1155266.1 hypothetical protein [Microvirga mediterraneensis]
MSDITLQEIPVLADGGRHEGQLVLADGQLVAVFTWVTPEETVGGPERAGGWFLEAGFGPCGGLLSTTPPVLATLDDAVTWVRSQLNAGLSRP